jgi:hypothetical protein
LFENIDKAVAAWNTRATDPAVARLVKAARWFADCPAYDFSKICGYDKNGHPLNIEGKMRDQLRNALAAFEVKK